MCKAQHLGFALKVGLDPNVIPQTDTDLKVRQVEIVIDNRFHRNFRKPRIGKKGR